MNNESGFQNFNNQNFDPNQVAQQTSSVIQIVLVLDVSPSIASYAASMNTATTEVFMKELKNSHRKNDILIKAITFCEKVEHKSGFMPILSLTDDYLHIEPQGRSTALYDAVLEALNHVAQYRNDLEDQGIDVRTCVFIVTDGEDMCSSHTAAPAIKQKVEELRSNEAWINSFSINMLGVGKDANFRGSCIEMGLNPDKCLSTIQSTAKEIRAQMGVISQSVSSSAAGQNVTF